MRLASILMGAITLWLAAAASAQPGPSLIPEPQPKLASPTGPEPTAAQLTAADVGGWLDGLMPYAIESGDVAGAVVAVVKDGRIIALKGYGYADVEKRRPIDATRTLFRPASVSKLFTWTAVMQLVEQGKLDLDRDVNAYLDFKIPPYRGQPITLRNIMTHTAGFEEAARDVITPDMPELTLGEKLKRWIPKRVYAPGSTPAYSNYATGLAGYIVERVSGEKFEDYVERHIFKPLQMNHSSFRQPLPKPLMAALSKGYQRASEASQPFEYVNPAPAGALSSTARDMANFMIAHLQDGGFGGARILRPETARLMHTTAHTVLPPLNRMVLGFYEQNINGRRVISHAGDTVQFHSELHLFIDDGVGLFMSVNSLGKEAAAARVRSALFEEFADRYFANEQNDGSVSAGTAAEHARMIAGTYENSRRSHSNFLAAFGLLGQPEIVANPDGTIMIPALTGLNGVPRKWREIAPFVWRDLDGDSRLAAKVVDGRVVRFSIDELSPFMVFDRVPAWRSSSWLRPLALAGTAALALTLVSWPVAALVRRRYGAQLAIKGRSRLAYRGVRIAALLGIAAVAGWALLVGKLDGNPSLPPLFDVQLVSLMLLSLVAFAGGLGVAVWNLALAWRDRRGWFSRLWGLILVIAFAALLWAAVAYRLLSFTTDF